jgi:hypothetical protein
MKKVLLADCCDDITTAIIVPPITVSCASVRHAQALGQLERYPGEVSGNASVEALEEWRVWHNDVVALEKAARDVGHPFLPIVQLLAGNFDSLCAVMTRYVVFGRGRSSSLASAFD